MASFYGWWVSPTGILYEVDRHGAFMLQNPKLFGGVPPDDEKRIYDFALRKGWIRVVNSTNATLEIEIPEKIDKYLITAKCVIPYGAYESVYISWGSNYLEDIPYMDFLTSYGFRALESCMMLDIVSRRMRKRI
jgi:hypothetical protein